MNDKSTSTAADAPGTDIEQLGERRTTGRTLGIRAKLFLAFCAMAGLTAVAGVVAWFAFSEISTSVERITSESVPAMSASLELAEKSAEISAMAPSLMASPDRAQRQTIRESLSERTRELDTLIGRFETVGVDTASVDGLRRVHDEMSTGLAALDASVDLRLSLEARRHAVQARLSQAQAQFQEVLEPLVDDAVFDMIISSERLTSRSSDSITELVDGGVRVLNDLMSVSAESHLVAGLLAEAARVSDPSYLQPLRERFTASAESIARGVRALPDSGNKLKLQHATGELLALGSGADNIFELRRLELGGRGSAGAGDPARSSGDVTGSRREQFVRRLREAHRELLETLVPIVDDAVFELVIDSETLSARSRDDITRLVGGGVNTLHLLLAMRAQGNLAAGLLAESAAVTDTSLLQPLRERFTAARSHVEQSLNQLSPALGDNRLREAVSSLLSIGAGIENLFDLRLRELEEIAQSERLLEASQSLAIQVHDEVAGLVASARSDSDLAARRSAEAIHGGKLLLIAIVAASIVGAATIMIFLVARRVVRPLQAMTRAMVELAGGNTSVRIPAQGSTDEVGEMAKALKVFRDTAVEVQETNLREIRETRRRLIDAIESMSEGLSLYDAADRLVVCNTRYRQILYPGMHDLVTPGTTYESIVREAAQTGLIKEAEVNVEEWVQQRLARHREPGEPHVQQRGDGRWVRINERRTEDGGTVAVYTDITDDRKREQELREAKERAERTLEELTQTQQSLIHAEKMASLGQLSAGVAHEIKNPLNFVKNFAESTQEAVDELSDFLTESLSGLDESRREDIENQIAMVRSFLGKISEHGKRADGIVKSMLAHAGEGSSELQAVDLNALVGETVALTYHSVRAEHDDFNMEVQKELDSSLGPLEVYPQDITRVLLNVVGNACYALQLRKSCDENPDYRPALKIATRDLGDRVEVRIRDNGTGIPEPVRSRIFEPFYTTKPPGEGTGLGLSLSYEAVVKQHHGQMAVNSEEGEFTEFIITLPRTASAAFRADGTT